MRNVGGRLVSLVCLLLMWGPTSCGSSKSSGKKDNTAGNAGAEAGGGSDGGSAEDGGTDSRAGTGNLGQGGSVVTRCLIASDCSPGMQCLNQRCVTETTCRNSRDCPATEVCSPSGRCVECVDDIECGTGLTCVGNVCRGACASDRDCLDMMLLCDKARGRCVECLGDGDCATERTCADGTCMTTVIGAGGSAGATGEGGGVEPGQGGRQEEGGQTGQGGTGNTANAGTAGSPITSGGTAGTGTAGTPAAGTANGGTEAGGAPPGAGTSGAPVVGGTAGTGTGGVPSDGGTAGTPGQGGAPPQAGGTPGYGGAVSYGGAAPLGCGNGILDYGEACDDGNSANEDCCSSSCQIETGCLCSQQPLAQNANVLLSATYRDFREGGDFEPAEATGITAPATGLVEATLDGDGKPALVGAPPEDSFITSAASFANWYRDVEGTNETLEGTFALYETGGSVVNRYAADGEPWLVTDQGVYCGIVGYEQLDEQGDPIPCTFCPVEDSCQQTDCDTNPPYACVLQGETYYGQYAYDGNPAFFPVDGVAFTPSAERTSALIPMYYAGGWQPEPGEALHNFHFTSEIRFAFQYNGTQQIEVTGDDDIWVFIDGKLAIDLGGLHTPVEAVLTLDSAGDASVRTENTEETDPWPIVNTVPLGLVTGQVYNVVVFQAERKTDASTFKLRLSGINLGRSLCDPI